MQPEILHFEISLALGQVSDTDGMEYITQLYHSYYCMQPRKLSFFDKLPYIGIY